MDAFQTQSHLFKLDSQFGGGIWFCDEDLRVFVQVANVFSSGFVQGCKRKFEYNKKNLKECWRTVGKRRRETNMNANSRKPLPRSEIRALMTFIWLIIIIKIKKNTKNKVTVADQFWSKVWVGQDKISQCQTLTCCDVALCLFVYKAESSNQISIRKSEHPLSLSPPRHPCSNLCLPKCIIVFGWMSTD